MIQVEHLVKTYPGQRAPAVNDIDLAVPQGSFFTLVGPSGCGKTTTLRCIAGLERPDRGRIDLGSTTVVSDRIFVPTHRRPIGMVFQSYAVWPHMTVFENVAFPLRVSGRRLPRGELERKVHDALALVGMEGFTSRMGTLLSGGQQQRVAVARALVREPDVLLLDEPLSNLDAKLRERMRRELLLIQRRVGITTLFVTHDQVEALSMSDRIAVMDRGNIVQEGTPRAIYHKPASEFVASFIGSTNILRATVSSVDVPGEATLLATPIGELVSTAQGFRAGESVNVAVRPEDIVVDRSQAGPAGDAATNAVRAVVEVGQFTGVTVDYIAVVGDERLQVRANARVDLQAGDGVTLRFPPDAVHVFRLDAENSL